jgi:hypothetical protein
MTVQTELRPGAAEMLPWCPCHHREEHDWHPGVCMCLLISGNIDNSGGGGGGGGEEGLEMSIPHKLFDKLLLNQ